MDAFFDGVKHLVHAVEAVITLMLVVTGAGGLIGLEHRFPPSPALEGAQ
jgi:hypothetical protein